MSEVAVFGFLRFPFENLDDVAPHLKALVETTYENDGCIAYDVGFDPFDPGLIRFSELWPDRQSLDDHLNSPHVETWRTAARECGLMERKFDSYDLASEAKPV